MSRVAPSARATYTTTTTDDDDDDDDDANDDDACAILTFTTHASPPCARDARRTDHARSCLECNPPFPRGPHETNEFANEFARARAHHHTLRGRVRRVRRVACVRAPDRVSRRPLPAASRTGATPARRSAGPPRGVDGRRWTPDVRKVNTPDVRKVNTPDVRIIDRIERERGGLFFCVSRASPRRDDDDDDDDAGDAGRDRADADDDDDANDDDAWTRDDGDGGDSGAHRGTYARCDGTREWCGRDNDRKAIDRCRMSIWGVDVYSSI